MIEQPPWHLAWGPTFERSMLPPILPMHRLRTPICATAIAIFALTTAVPCAYAQPKPGENEPMNDAARALFTEAVAAWQKKDFATCRVKALGAWGVKKHPQIASLLGICGAELGGFDRESAEHLAFAIESGEDQHPERGTDVRAAFEKVKARIATVKVTLEITKQGYEPMNIKLDVFAGGQEQLSIELLVEGTKGGNGKDPEPRGEKPIWPYIVLGGVGAAGLGAGIGLMVAGVGATGDYEGTPCAGGEDTCPQDVQDAVSERNTLVGVSAGMFALGGAAIAGLIGYAVWSGPEADAGAKDEAWIIPAVGPEHFGVVFGTRF